MCALRVRHTDCSYPFTLAALTQANVFVIHCRIAEQERNRIRDLGFAHRARHRSHTFPCRAAGCCKLKTNTDQILAFPCSRMRRGSKVLRCEECVARSCAGRICLPDLLHAYPGTTNARVDLPSCVTPSLPSGTGVGRQNEFIVYASFWVFKT
jgi:hypothetical protein